MKIKLYTNLGKQINILYKQDQSKKTQMISKPSSSVKSQFSYRKQFILDLQIKQILSILRSSFDSSFYSENTLEQISTFEHIKMDDHNESDDFYILNQKDLNLGNKTKQAGKMDGSIQSQYDQRQILQQKFKNMKKVQKLERAIDLMEELNERKCQLVFHNEIKFFQTVFSQQKYKLKHNKKSLFIGPNWQTTINKLITKISTSDKYHNTKDKQLKNDQIYKSIRRQIKKSYFQQEQIQLIQLFKQDNSSMALQLQKINYLQFAFDLLKLSFVGNNPQFTKAIQNILLRQISQNYQDKFIFDKALNYQSNQSIAKKLILLLKSCSQVQSNSYSGSCAYFSQLNKLILDLYQQQKNVPQTIYLSLEDTQNKINDQYLQNLQPLTNEKSDKQHANESFDTLSHSQSDKIDEYQLPSNDQIYQQKLLETNLVDQVNQVRQQYHDVVNNGCVLRLNQTQNSILPFELYLNQRHYQNSKIVEDFINQSRITSMSIRQDFQQMLNGLFQFLYKVETYGKYVKKEQQYYQKFVCLDLYQSDLKEINLKIIIESPLRLLQFISVGMYPIKTEGLRKLMQVEWPNLVGLEAWCSSIDTLVDSKLQLLPQLQFLSISFNNFAEDTIQYFKNTVFKKLKILKISFKTIQLWIMFSQVYKKTFPDLKTLFIRSQDANLISQIDKKIKNGQIFAGFDDINHRQHLPSRFSFQPIVVLQNKKDN